MAVPAFLDPGLHLSAPGRRAHRPWGLRGRNPLVVADGRLARRAVGHRWRRGRPVQHESEHLMAQLRLSDLSDSEHNREVAEVLLPWIAACPDPIMTDPVELGTRGG